MLDFFYCPFILCRINKLLFRLLLHARIKRHYGFARYECFRILSLATPTASARVSLFYCQGSIILMCYLFHLFLQTTEILSSSFSCYLLASSTGFFNHILHLISSINEINMLIKTIYISLHCRYKRKILNSFNVLVLYFGFSVVSFHHRWLPLAPKCKFIFFPHYLQARSLII